MTTSDLPSITTTFPAQPAVDPNLQQALINVTRERDQLLDALRTTMEALHDEASNRNWCSLYEDFVDGLPALARDLSPSERFAYKATMEYTVRIHCTVTAANSQHATDRLHDFYMKLAESNIFLCPGNDDHVEAQRVTWENVSNTIDDDGVLIND